MSFTRRRVLLVFTERVEAPSFLSLQSCTRTLDRLYASTRSVYAKWYWVNHGRLTSEQSCTRTLEHEMVDLLGKSRQDNHALEHKSRQAHQRTITHSNTRTLEDENWYWVNHGRTIMHSNINHGRLTSEQSRTRTLEHSKTKWYWVNHGRTIMHSNTRQAKSRQARALKRQASCLCTRTLEHELKRQASCLCTRTLEHEMVLGKSRQDNHALEHKSRQAHQRTIMHSNTRTLEDEMVLGKSRQDNHALEHSTG